MQLVRDKDYFVITTNVDHRFQKVGFDKKRLFYTQGDYGLFQSVNPAIQKTYDNEEWVVKAMEAQCSEEIAERAICVNGDIKDILDELNKIRVKGSLDGLPFLTDKWQTRVGLCTS